MGLKSYPKLLKEKLPNFDRRRQMALGKTRVGLVCVLQTRFDELGKGALVGIWGGGGVGFDFLLPHSGLLPFAGRGKCPAPFPTHALGVIRNVGRTEEEVAADRAGSVMSARALAARVANFNFDSLTRSLGAKAHFSAPRLVINIETGQHFV